MPGHARQLVVAFEEVLNGHAGRGDRFQGDLQPLLGLDGLVQSILPLASGHHTAGELVDDDDLAVDRDVIAVFEIGDLGAERSLDVFVEPVDGQADERRVGGDRLNLAPAGGRQLGLALQGIVLVILDADQGGRELVGTIVGGRLFLGRLIVGPDDQRRSRLVDQDAVGLVDDREIVGALHGHLPLEVAPAAQIDLLERLAVRVAAELQLFQLVAQEVEAKLLGRPVGDVAGIGGAADGVALAGLDAADRQARASGRSAPSIRRRGGPGSR